MTAQEEREMHDLAVTLAQLTSGTGWEAFRYLTIGQVMQRLSEYCAVSSATCMTDVSHVPMFKAKEGERPHPR